MGMQDEIRTALKKETPHVDAKESLRHVIKTMAQGKASALVVKTGDIVAGIVSDMDLLRAVMGNQDLDATTAAELMSPCELITAEGAANPCAQLDETETIENALGVIEAAGTHNLLVSGADHATVGIVSIRDLLEAAIA